MTNSKKYKFKRGQEIHLDRIYQIQGIGDDIPGIGQWWKHKDADQGGDSDELIVTQDIEIEITVRTPNGA